MAGPDDFVLAEPNDQFGGHESWHYVAPHDLFSLLCQLRQEASRPRPVAEQFGDLTPLAVVLMLGDRLAFERFAVEIATQHEGAIVLDLMPIEAEESMLGLEVADLQDAIDLGLQARPAAGERQFRFGQRQVFQPLSIVEVR